MTNFFMDKFKSKWNENKNFIIVAVWHLTRGFSNFVFQFNVKLPSKEVKMYFSAVLFSQILIFSNENYKTIYY